VTRLLEADHPRNWRWPFWPIVPLYPYGQRRTLRQEVIQDTLWTFDQLQGIFYVVVPVRMTVIRLQRGGLLVYAPVAPTPECVQLVQELVVRYGEVKYIILPTVTGLEHKVFVGPFARKFPQAEVWVAPQQWSFPLNLPLSWLGFPVGRTRILPEDAAATPFGDEFDYQILGPIGLGLGPFAEVAFFHKPSRTLLVVDAVVSIPVDPPAIVQIDSYPLLFHARDRAQDVPEDTPANRRKGWQRIALFAFYFRPGALLDPDWGEALRQALKAPDRSRKAYFGVFPFKWRADWQRSFERLSNQGRLLVAPVLQTLIFNQGPEAVLQWADEVARWEFQRIIPCHLEAPIVADGADFRRAFTFLEAAAGVAEDLPAEDFDLLRRINRGLTKRGIMPAAPEQG
jgi:hypothetical protein